MSKILVWMHVSRGPVFEPYNGNTAQRRLQSNHDVDIIFV